MLQPKKPLKQLIQNAFKKGTEKSSDPNKYVQNKTNVFGKQVHKEISKNKFDRVSNRYKKQEGSKELGNKTSIGQQVISGKKPNNSVSRYDEQRGSELKNAIRNAPDDMPRMKMKQTKSYKG